MTVLNTRFDNNSSWGGLARNNRLFINAVFWILRTSAVELHPIMTQHLH